MEVILIQGCSGAGKSRYANRIANGALILSSDDYFVRKNGQYVFNPKELSKSHAACFSKFLRALQAGEQRVIVDNTNTTASALNPYVMAIEAHNFEKPHQPYRWELHRVVCLDIDAAVEFNTHGVQRYVIERHLRELAEFDRGGNRYKWPVKLVEEPYGK